jgi:adenosylcobinamide-GDP ribazoletransferase
MDMPATIGRSMPFFPVVGLIIGILLTFLYWTLGMVFPRPITGALIVAVLAVVTGAHHLDGLIDTFDATAAGRTREQRLEIMSDTRVGAFGITAACLILIIKYAAITVTGSPALIVAFPILSRWALCSSIIIFPSARKHGSGFAVKSNAGWHGFALATAITASMLLFVIGLTGALIFMACLLALSLLIGLSFKRMFGGLTGDCYGALVEIGEALALLLIILLTPIELSIPGYNLLQLPFMKG